MKRVLIGIILLSLVFIAIQGHSQVPGSTAAYVVQGEIFYHGSAVLLIYLVDEESFSRKGEGLQVLRLDIEAGEGRVPFEFRDVPPGVYGIRCFADENGNGELDGGAFGPKEPWGMSWQGEARRGIPRFRDISFQVEADSALNIILRS